MESLINSMRPQLKESGIPETRENCKAEFVSRVRDNLHIILAMSPVGDAFRVRCRQFPSLINCCTIDWYLPWPETALESVAMRFIGSVELPAEEMRIALADACVHVHTSIAHMGERFFETLRRKTYTTPKSYLDLVELYLSMLKEKRSEYGGARNRLDNGVIKLAETNEMVGKLKASLEQLMPTLEQKSKETDGLLKQVAKEQSDAKKVEEKVSAEEARVNEEAAQVAKLQAEAKRDLDKAMPALEEAIAALDSLDKKDITEMKSFKTPPPAVMTVMEAVNVLLGEKADWDTAKRVLGNMHLIENLKQFDKDSISSGVLKKLRKYTNDPIMQVENVKKVSSAATSLCMWCHAMDIYSAVAKEVGPKRARLEKMNEALDEANAALAEKQAALKEIVDKVNELKRVCDETLAEKNRLVSEAEKTRKRLVRAEKLTDGLAEEGVRWKERVVELDADLKALVGDTFLAAACVSYYGAFTGSFRDELVTSWHAKILELGLPCSKTFSL